MHIGKNVSESLINTFLRTTEKSKDNLNSRLDHWGLGIRSDLHPVEVDDQMYLLAAPYSMSSDEKKNILSSTKRGQVSWWLCIRYIT